jgi:hypothetical protein
MKTRNPQFIPNGGSATTTIEQDGVFAIGVKIARGLK